MSDVIVATYRTDDGNLGVMFKSDYVYTRKSDRQTMAQIILDNDDLVTLAVRPIPAMKTRPSRRSPPPCGNTARKMKTVAILI
jgi:hypothetical protein